MSRYNDEVITKCLDQDPCGERLIATIVAELQAMKNAGYDVKNIYDLGFKLLEHDYYSESEEYLQALMNTDMSKEQTNLMISKFAVQHTEDYKQKTLDYLTFFNTLVLNIEDWCDLDD
jgi:archaellum biogenesis ATPase FlaH